MSAHSLISQIKEDYLTCSICFNSFSKPKALPCLHTFCEECLKDYIFSKGYEISGYFPCPFCRVNTAIPEMGVEGFPNNHLMSSLSDTIDKSMPFRPVPKPRRSLGNPQVQQQNQVSPAPGDISTVDTLLSPGLCSSNSELDLNAAPEQEPPLYGDNHEEEPSCTSDIELTNCNSTTFMPQPGSIPTLSNWPSNVFPEINPNYSIDFTDPPPPYYPPLDDIAFPTYPYPTGQLLPSTAPWNTNEQFASSGWSFNALSNAYLHTNPSQESTNGVPSQENTNGVPSQENTGVPSPTDSNDGTGAPLLLYPQVPIQTEISNIACNKNLLLRFGKLGSSVRDFLKPFGLAVSNEGNYLISDNGGDRSRIFIFNSMGQLTSAFNCNCKVKNLLITKGNDILVAVHKNISAVYHFTMTGVCKAEYGKFFTYEEPSGISQLTNGCVVLSGVKNHCVYILTDKMKLASKFGKKGSGNGYFQYPGYIAVDSKNNIIVTDKVNNCVQIFTTKGLMKQRFGEPGAQHGQLQSPLGVCVDGSDKIIVADSGNYRVDVFSSRGRWLSSVVTDTHELGEGVKPVNVAITPSRHLAVLLRGPYYAEVRVYSYR